MKKILAATTAGSLMLAGCGAGSFNPDTTTTNFIQAATVAAKTFCGLLPTASTLAQIVLALALPAGVPVEQVASAAAHAFCDQVAPIVAQRAGRRAIEPSTGRAVTDYGQVIINGRPVNVQVYVQ